MLDTGDKFNEFSIATLVLIGNEMRKKGHKIRRAR